MSKRINIIWPDTTVAVLDRTAIKGARSRFIDRAARHYVETQSRQSFREQLKEDYRANAECNLAIATEWSPPRLNSEIELRDLTNRSRHSTLKTDFESRRIIHHDRHPQT